MRKIIGTCNGCCRKNLCLNPINFLCIDCPSPLQKDSAVVADHPLATQVGGDHYKNTKIQPIEYIQANGLDFEEGNIIKYVSRHKTKNGKKDIEKIKHYCDFIIKRDYS